MTKIAFCKVVLSSLQATLQATLQTTLQAGL